MSHLHRLLPLILCGLAMACSGESSDVTSMDIRGPDMGEVRLDPGAQGLLEQYKLALSQSEDMTFEELLELYYQPRPFLEDAELNAAESEDYAFIAQTMGLGPDHTQRIEKTGFIIEPSIRYDSHAMGYQEIYVQDLPVLITVDSMLFALHKSYDRMLMQLESGSLIPTLEKMLAAMKGALPAMQSASSDATYQSALRDADLFLTVAHRLLTLQETALLFPENEESLAVLLAGADSLQPRSIQLFGRPYPCADPACAYDFSQFKPRGHYTDSPQLEQYFRAMMWLGRTQAFVTRYPREMLFAHVLHQLLLDSGRMASWTLLDQAIAVFVGDSDNLTHDGYGRFLQEHPETTLATLIDPVSSQALMQELESGSYGNQLISSQIMAGEPMAQEPGLLPPVYCLLGQRFVLDSYVFHWVVFDRITWQGSNPLRMMPDPLDALFVLGHQEALPLLQSQLETYHYAGNLHVLKTLVDTYDDAFWDASMYSVWLSAIGLLGGDTTSDLYPAFMRTREYAVKSIQTAAASWAELRHDTILYAKQSYTGIVCDYPDGYVEPLPDVYGRLAEFASRSSDLLGQLDFGQGWQANQVKGFFSRFSEVMLILKGISEKQLAGEPRTPDETAFIKELVVDQSMCGGPPFSGWYADLFFEASDTSFMFDPTIADVHTDPNSTEVLHVGTGFAHPMVVLVNNHCGLRSYVGPVSSFYEHREGGFGRLTDEDWKSRMNTDPDPPRPGWTAILNP
jgi:hypothetical protein